MHLNFKLLFIIDLESCKRHWIRRCQVPRRPSQKMRNILLHQLLQRRVNSLFPVSKTKDLQGKIEFIEFFDIEHLNADIKFFNGLLAVAHGAADLSDAANVCIPLYANHANAALAAANVLATTAGTGADAILSDVLSKLATAVALASALVGVIPDGDAARAAVMASIDALEAASKAFL